MTQVSSIKRTDELVDRRKEMNLLLEMFGENMEDIISFSQGPRTRFSRLEEFFLALREVKPGFNFRLFPHENRLALAIMYARPDSVRIAVRQVYRALSTDKTCFFSSSRGYKCFVLNPHVTLFLGLVGLLGAASNPDLINQVIRLFFSVPK